MSVAVLDGPRRDRRRGLELAAERIGVRVLAPVLLALMLALVFARHDAAIDFQAAYYPAAHRLLTGLSPYAVSHQDIVGGTAFVYPALSAIVLAPFALLGSGFAAVLITLLCLACVPATLYVLAVRDARLYAAALLWLPVFSGWQTANLTLPLMLLIALTWRHRERPVVAGLLTAAAISLKPFVWPLALWLLATRRFRAAAASVVWAVALNLLAWALIGVDELHAFLRVSSRVTGALWNGGYGLPALASHIGLGRGPSGALLVVASAAVGCAVIYSGLFRRRDRAALTLAVALMLVASPLVRSHYYALLLIPCALQRPRPGWVWLAPILMWVCAPAQDVAGWQAGVAWALTAGMVGSVLRDGSVGRRSADRRPQTRHLATLVTTG
jgi:alpha-1,2-mannosyltransferase